jgi:hypothetical protein
MERYVLMSSILVLHIANTSDSQRNTASIYVSYRVSQIDAYAISSTEIPSGTSHGEIIDHSM